MTTYNKRKENTVNSVQQTSDAVVCLLIPCIAVYGIRVY